MSTDPSHDPKTINAAISQIASYVRRGYTNDQPEIADGKIVWLQYLAGHRVIPPETYTEPQKTWRGTQTITTTTIPMNVQDLNKIVSRNSHNAELEAQVDLIGALINTVDDNFGYTSRAERSTMASSSSSHGIYRADGTVPSLEPPLQQDFDYFLLREDPGLLRRR